MEKLRCIIVDDEPLALELLKDYVSKIPFLELQTTFDNALDAMTHLHNQSADLLLLDIQMPDLNGLQLVESLLYKPEVIFITAYSQYAVKGFEIEATDYLLKPVSFERFLKAVNKVYQKKKQQNTVSVESMTETDEPDYFFIKSGYQTHRIEVKKILYVEGMKDYLRIQTTESQIMVLQNFKTIEERLPSPPFIRVHKSFIVCIDKIDSYDKRFIYIANKEIPVGDVYRKSFLDMVKENEI